MSPDISMQGLTADCRGMWGERAAPSSAASQLCDLEGVTKPLCASFVQGDKKETQREGSRKGCTPSALKALRTQTLALWQLLLCALELSEEVCWTPRPALESWLAAAAPATEAGEPGAARIDLLSLRSGKGTLKAGSSLAIAAKCSPGQWPPCRGTAESRDLAGVSP